MTFTEFPKVATLAAAELDCEAAGCAASGLEEVMAALELLDPALFEVEAVLELLAAVAVDDSALDPELDPRHPVATPKHWNCTLPQNWPNLQDQLSP